MITHATIKKIGKLSLLDPQFGDLKLSVMPFENNGQRIKLPVGFEMWEDILNEIAKTIPQVEGANQHYVTIDTKFFTQAEFLRREGIHLDGNFCVDPNFGKASWGGTQPTWGGARLVDYVAKPDNSHVKMDWVLPYPNLMIPIGDYVSGEKGGLLCIATEVGCQGWQGEFFGEVGAEGDCSSMTKQFTDDRKVVFEKDTLYFMTSNTPHETLLIDKGKRRTLLRITLNHEYPNQLLPCMTASKHILCKQ